MTAKYDDKNPHHVHLREALEWGNGLPRLTTIKQTIQALNDAGFEVIETFDTLAGTHSKTQIPWYAPLAGEFSIKGFRHHPIGRNITNIMCAALEILRIAPKGTTKVAKLLHKTAEDLVESGQLEIFTPDYFWLVRKPTTSK
jgi:sterol 24-C-methyltransferase